MIHTLTLNPAVDKILYVDKFIKNVTTRILRTCDTIGGKGTHVSINLSLMGGQSNAFGMAHGETGKKVLAMLEEYPGLNVLFLYREENNTRTNYLLNESNGDSTLITEKGVELTESDLNGIIKCLEDNSREGDILAFSGDASNYPDPYVYNHILDALRHKNYRVFLDTSGQSLIKCLEKHPFLIKPNTDELSFVCGRSVSEETDDVIDAIRSLDAYDIPVVAVSMGGAGSLVKYYGEFFRVTPPAVNVENTVGCGDCYLAGLLHGFAADMGIEGILRHATAVSAAAAECPLSAGFSPQRANELLDKVIVEKL